MRSHKVARKTPRRDTGFVSGESTLAQPRALTSGRKACPPPDLDVVCLHSWRRHTWRVLEGEPIIKPGAKIHVYTKPSDGLEPSTPFLRFHVEPILVG